MEKKATQLVEKAILTPEEAKWFEKNKHLPFVDHESGIDFYNEAYISSYYWTFYYDCEGEGGIDIWMKRANSLYKAYFNGYVLDKELKYE